MIKKVKVTRNKVKDGIKDYFISDVYAINGCGFLVYEPGVKEINFFEDGDHRKSFERTIIEEGFKWVEMSKAKFESNISEVMVNDFSEEQIIAFDGMSSEEMLSLSDEIFEDKFEEIKKFAVRTNDIKLFGDVNFRHCEILRRKREGETQ